MRRMTGAGLSVSRTVPRALTTVVLLFLSTACTRTIENRHAAPADTPVIIISIDTLRADHLPAYGYRGVETPAIDRFAHDAIVFENAYSHVPLTLPSHVSMLTGTLPPDHGVRDNSGFAIDPSRTPMLPTLLRARGYTTGAAISAYVLRGATGLGPAFDFYDDRMPAGVGKAQGDVQRSGEVTAATAQRWIADNASRPFFFFLHLYEPHSPYTPPEPFRSRYASGYDGEIATADAIAGRFFDFLRARDLYDRSIIILLSDHGEGLNQHGEEEHGIFLYREAVHVPLMIKLPRRERGNTRVTRIAGLIDIVPTIASLIGFPSPPSSRGSSLLANSPAPSSLYAETLYPRLHLGWSDLRSLIDARHQYIEAPRSELFDLARDPAEQHDLIQTERRTAASMRKDLSRFARGLVTPAAIAPEEAKKLAALGYLTAATAADAGPLPDPKDGIAQLAAMRAAARRDASGDPAGAMAAYQAIVASNPRFRDAWNLLAKTQAQAGRTREAIESYQRSIRLAPSLPSDEMLEVARLSLELGLLDEAQQHAQLVLRSSPTQAHLLLGRVALARRDFANAEREARTAMRTDSSSRDAQVLLAQALVGMARFREAASVIDDVARSSSPGTVPLLDLVRGDLLARSDHIAEAVAAFTRETVAFPHERQPYASLALLQLLQGRRAEAMRTLEALVRANPDAGSYVLAAKTLEAVGDARGAQGFRARAARGGMR